MYADDWVILAPYIAGLSKLLSIICGIFGESNEIMFNQKKVVLLCISFLKCYKELFSPNVYLTYELSDDIDTRRQCRGDILFRKFHIIVACL